MYYLAKFIQWILLRLPLGVSLFLGKLIGFFLYSNARKRRTAFRNFKLAFPHESTAKVHSILRKSFCSFGLGIVENLIAPRVYKYVSANGIENMSSKEGGLYITIHAGNWEVTTAHYIRKRKYAVLAKPQKHKSLDKFLNDSRAKAGIKVCFSLKEFITCIKNNYMIGIVVDQGAEKDALDIEFFSHLVPTPQGAVYLAKKFNKLIYPTFSHRIKGFQQVIEFAEPINPVNRDTKDVLIEINKFYQTCLEKYPWEYNWYYKRFKHKKNRNVLILNDMKAGHFKQSKALAELLTKNASQSNISTVEIKYKNKITRSLADLCAFFSGDKCQGCGRCLKFFLDTSAAKALNNICPDFVVSTGSIAAPINKIFSVYTGSKSIVILRPNVPLRKFDLVIVPEHDRIEADNVIKIKGALVSFKNVSAKKDKCKDFFKLSAEKKLALFIGGPLRNKKIFFENLKIFTEQLRKFCIENKFKLLLSTSRRTPGNAEQYLKQEFQNLDFCEALIIANENNYDFIFEGFCSLSEFILVSSESISMVTEAASFNKPCVSVSLEKEDLRHSDFLISMKNEIDFLKKPYNMKELKLNSSSVFENNRLAVEEGIKKIL